MLEAVHLPSRSRRASYGRNSVLFRTETHADDGYNLLMRVFALDASSALGKSITSQLGCELDPHEEREFSYGEHKVRPLVSVWAEDVYVISSLHGDKNLSVNDKICRLLFFVGALKDAGAHYVTAVLPYLAYSRKDQRTKSRDPVTTRYVATVLQSVGVDRVITMDVHNQAALDNSFRCPTVNLSTAELFAEHYVRTIGNSVDTVVSPDLGGLKATRAFIDVYERVSGCAPALAVVDKRRSEGQVSGSGLIGTVGDHVLVVDDMIGSGTTLCRAASACREAGATKISVGATHGLFQEGAPRLFEQRDIDSITVTDTVAIDMLSLAADKLARVTTISTAPVFADCLREI